MFALGVISAQSKALNRLLVLLELTTIYWAALVKVIVIHALQGLSVILII